MKSGPYADAESLRARMRDGDGEAFEVIFEEMGGRGAHHRTHGRGHLTPPPPEATSRRNKSPNDVIGMVARK